MAIDKEIILEPVWTVVANIVHERPYGPNGAETKIGTKYFRAGTKVYIIDWFPGMCEDIIVVGLSRKPRRYITIVIRADWVENLRIKLCYTPSALRKIYEHFNNDNIGRLTHEFVTSMHSSIPEWQKEMEKKL